jgi:hypothetical protein
LRIKKVLIAPASHWQNCYVERLMDRFAANAQARFRSSLATPEALYKPQVANISQAGQ